MAWKNVLSRLATFFKVSSKAVVTKKTGMKDMTFCISLSASANPDYSRPFQATFKNERYDGRCTYVCFDTQHGECKMGFYPRQWQAFRNGERDKVQGSFVFKERADVQVTYVAMLSPAEATATA